MQNGSGTDKVWSVRYVETRLSSFSPCLPPIVRGWLYVRGLSICFAFHTERIVTCYRKSRNCPVLSNPPKKADVHALQQQKKKKKSQCTQEAREREEEARKLIHITPSVRKSRTTSNMNGTVQ